LYWKNLVTYFESTDLEDGEILNNVPAELRKILSENDINLIFALWKGIKSISDFYERFRFRDGLMETMNVARAANKYFNDEEPWKTIKEDSSKCAKTLYICVQVVNSLAVLFAPVVPFTSKKIFNFLNVKPQTGEPNQGHPNKDFWSDCACPSLKDGSKLNLPELLFTKIEDETIDKQISKLGNKSELPSVEPEELIEIDDFAKVKLLTAKIISAENVKKSKKLLKLQVDIGTEKRQILAGIAEHYKPEDLVGKIVIVVANLKPAKLMGLESQGMMLAASDADGKLYFLTPEKDDIGIGAEVR
jgi:methionyl-tRNA synthetase